MKRLAKKWDFELNLTSVFADDNDQYTEDEIIEKAKEVSNEIDTLINKVSDLSEKDLLDIDGIDDMSEKEDLLDRLSGIKDDFEIVTDVEDFDAVLDELYDTADMYNIWVNK